MSESSWNNGLKMSCMSNNRLPEAIKLFDYPVFQFRCWGIIFRGFELKQRCLTSEFPRFELNLFVVLLVDQSWFTVFLGPCGRRVSFCFKWTFAVFIEPCERDNNLVCTDLRIMSMRDRQILKSPIQRISRRINRTYAARVMLSFGRFARSVDGSLDRSLARPLDRSIDRSVARSLARSLTRSLVRWFARSLGRSLVRSLTRPIDRSLTRPPA